MKQFRVLTILLALAIAFSVWAPSPVLARTADAPQAKAYTGPVNVSITNKTGATMFLQMTSGVHSYYFSVPLGKHTYQVAAGKYTFTIYGCGGSATRSKNLKGKSANLGTWVCRH